MPKKPKAYPKLAAAIVLIVIAAACFSGLLRVDSAASWIIGILFIDELIIVAIVLAAAIIAVKDRRKIRTSWSNKR
jgi:nitrogen fixation/metabolism regulation signal transduction histidine kinase